MSGTISLVNETEWKEMFPNIPALSFQNVTGADNLIEQAEAKSLTPVKIGTELRYFQNNEFYTPLTGGTKYAPILRDIYTQGQTATLSAKFMTATLTQKQFLMSALPPLGLKITDYAKIPAAVLDSVKSAVPNPTAFIDEIGVTYLRTEDLDSVRKIFVGQGAYEVVRRPYGSVTNEPYGSYDIKNPVTIYDHLVSPGQLYLDTGDGQGMRYYGDYYVEDAGSTAPVYCMVINVTPPEIDLTRYNNAGLGLMVFVSESPISVRLGVKIGGQRYSQGTYEIPTNGYVYINNPEKPYSADVRKFYLGVWQLGRATYNQYSYQLRALVDTSEAQSVYSNVWALTMLLSLNPLSMSEELMNGTSPLSFGAYAGALQYLADAELVGGVAGVEPIVNAVYPTDTDKTLAEIYPTWAGTQKTVSGYDSTTAFFQTYIAPTDSIVSGDSQDSGQSGDTPFDNVKDNVSGSGQTGTPTVPNDPPADNTGTTPSAGSNTSSINAFMTAYNPTQAQIDALAAYLWTDDFIDNIKKLFANPMDVILGLSMIYATPATGAEKVIKAGWVDTNVSAKTITTQYITIDCGEVTVAELYGCALDYEPYTQVHCYLPFIGIVPLEANDVIGSKISISYRVDVMTGACLATLVITKGGLKAALYTFNGSCSVQIPITSGNYTAFASSLISAGANLLTTGLAGGNLATAAISSAAGIITGSRQQFQHSGTLAANAGVMGIKKPYLIIKHADAYTASYYNKYYGNPANSTVVLGSVSGYTRVKDVHIENIVATDDELDEIMELLKEGVLL